MLALAALAAAALVITSTAVSADDNTTRPLLPISDHEAVLVGRYELEAGAPNNSARCPLLAEVTAPLKGWTDAGKFRHDVRDDTLYAAKSYVKVGMFSFDGAECDADYSLHVEWSDRRGTLERAYAFYDPNQSPWLCGRHVRMNGIFVNRDEVSWKLYVIGANGFDCTYLGTDSEPKREDGSAGGTVAAPNTPVILNPQAESKDVDSPSPEETASCFPAAATVELADGSTAALGALPAGSTVRVGAGAHSDVFGWSHRQTGGRHPYVRLTHGDGAAAAAAATRDLLLSPGHLVYANGVRVPARDVVVGDALTTPGTATGVSRVVAVGTAVAVGKVNPHTLHGDVVVDGVLVSTYTDALHPAVAHALLAPARTAYRAGLSAEPLGRLLYNGVPGWGGWRA